MSADPDPPAPPADPDEDPEAPHDRAVRQVLITVATSFPAGGAGFLLLLLAAPDNPTTGTAALLIMLAIGFPVATYYAALMYGQIAWPRERAQLIAWLAALASLPVALLGALATVVFLAAVGVV